jgi:hypothetical protein
MPRSPHRRAPGDSDPSNTGAGRADSPRHRSPAAGHTRTPRDPEVTAATAQAPRQIRVLGVAGGDNLPIGRDDLKAHHVVARQTDSARQPADPTSERQAADPGGRDVAGGRGQAVRLGRPVQVAQQGAAADVGEPRVGIDAHSAHAPQVDQQPALGNALAQDAVPPAGDPQLQTLASSEADRLCDIGRVEGLHDQRRPLVHHRVPGGTGGVIAVVVRRDERSVQGRSQVLDRCGRGGRTKRRGGHGTLRLVVEWRSVLDGQPLDSAAVSDPGCAPEQLCSTTGA